MPKSTHTAVATPVATSKLLKVKPKIHWFKIITTAGWLTFDTFVFMLVFGILTAAVVFSFSSIALQWLFNILPIVLIIVFSLSIINLAHDAKKNPKEKSEA